MGFVGIPRYQRVFCGNGVKHSGNTAGMELAVMVLLQN